MLSREKLYLLGVITVIVLISMNQLITHQLLEEQSRNFKVEQYASKLRISSQDIGRDVLRLYTGADDDLLGLKEKILEWNRLRIALQEGDENLDIPPLESDSIKNQFALLNPIHESVASAVINSETIGELSNNIRTDIAEGSWAESLVIMDTIIAMFEDQSAARMNRLVGIEIFLGIISVLVLILGFFFIFRPVLKRMNEDHEKLGIVVAELEKSNEELEAFSYSVSHDLRAPLRSINGFSDILKEDYGKKLDDEGNRLLNIVIESASNMGHLIDDILDFSRLGRKEVSKEALDMTFIVNSVKDELLNKNRVKANVTTNLNESPNVLGDIALIKQVWVNLLGNAIKYSSGNSEIEIEIKGITRNGFAIYSTKDNGTGFDMKYHDKIFGVFQRLHDSADFEGTGVGLAIVKRIIEKHGGKVWAESKPGEGSTFFFSLPQKNK